MALAIYIDFTEGYNIVYDPRQQIISILMKSQENSAHLIKALYFMEKYDTSTTYDKEIIINNFEILISLK